MKDKELTEFKYKLFLGLLVFIIIGLIVFLFIKNKLFIEDSSITKSVNNKDTMLILVVENNCRRCTDSKKVLNDLNVNYFILNKNKERNYKKIIKQIKLEESDITIPTIIYVKKGKVYSYIYDIKSKKEIRDFIKSYNLNGGN